MSIPIWTLQDRLRKAPETVRLKQTEIAGKIFISAVTLNRNSGESALHPVKSSNDGLRILGYLWNGSIKKIMLNLHRNQLCLNALLLSEMVTDTKPNSEVS